MFRQMAPMNEKAIHEQALNIAKAPPVWPGDTISHALAKECEKRGWIKRDKKGYWWPTQENPYINATIQVVQKC